MTPEEKAANVGLLARVVMSWPKEDYTLFAGCTSVWLEKKQRWWDPYTSDADAMEMLDRFEHYNLNKHPEGCHCSVWRGGTAGHVTGPPLLEAICAACLEWARAQGGGNK